MGLAEELPLTENDRQCRFYNLNIELVKTRTFRRKCTEITLYTFVSILSVMLFPAERYSGGQRSHGCGKMRLFTFILTLFCVYMLELDFSHGHSDMSKLLLISFDGFRWDYLQMVKDKGKSTPHFDSLIKEGVLSKYGTKNVFVTKTFPNHYSLVTGMYEENHGVVGNELYDSIKNKTVPFVGKKASEEVDVNDQYWWNNGTTAETGPEPIWSVNQRGRGHELFKRNSGVMFWPGSTAKWKNRERIPYNVIKYNSSLPNKTRIDNIVKWFSREDNPINLGLLYFSEPDHLGHQVGPDHPRMIEMILALDGLMGYLISELKQHDLYEHMNMIVTSDHGMANINQTIYLFDHYPKLKNLVEVCVGHSPALNIIPKKGKLEEVLKILRNISGIHVYTHDDVPADYHYKHNIRILDIVVSGKLGTDISCKSYSSSGESKGNHGYNNSIAEMHPFFIARGPAFKKNFVSLKQFNSVDVYPMMCKILDMEAGPHDGDLSNIEHILSEEHDHSSLVTLITFLLAVMFAATVAGVVCVAACRVYRITKHRRRNLTLPLNMVAGQVPLLASEDEEIP